MKHLVQHLAAASCALFVGLAVGAPVTFTQSGYAGGGTLTGSFTYDDANNDGYVNFAAGELTAFEVAFTGNASVGTFTLGLADLESFGFRLDGGIWGDDADEGFGTPFTGTEAFVVLTGFGALGSRGGLVFDAAAGDAATDADVMVVDVGVQPVPEPQTVALVGAGLLAAAASRRRRPG